MDFEQSTHSQIFQYGPTVSFYSLGKYCVISCTTSKIHYIYVLVDNIQFAHPFDIYNMYNTDTINQLSFQLRLIIPKRLLLELLLFIVHYKKKISKPQCVYVQHFRRTGIRKSKKPLFETIFTLRFFIIQD